MKSTMRRAIVISLGLHLIGLLATFYIVVRERLDGEFIDQLVVDIFEAPKTRALPPKVRVEPVKAVPRHQFAKDARIHSPRSTSAEPTASPLRLNQTVEVNRSRHRLDTAHLASVHTDISTAVRELQTTRTTLPQTEADTPTGMGTRGLENVDTPGLQRAPHSMIHGILEAGDDDDSDEPSLNLPGTQRPALAQIGFDEAMTNLAEKIVKSSGGKPIDVVFVIDASGSMGDNINGVAEHLVDMIDVYKSSNINYSLGLTEFWAPGRPAHNVIRVLQLTQNMREYRQEIQRIQPRKDENAYDAIEQTIREMRFRPTSQKHLILVTDEPFTSLKGLTLDQVIAQCREFDIHVNVLGLPNNEHRILANETGGHWHQIPSNGPRMPRQMRSTQGGRSRFNSQQLRRANWIDTAQIGVASLANLQTHALDIILFVDSSLSMEDKLPEFLTQLEQMVRDWDNAVIDYQIGVVRFRSGTGNFNYINVFQPPQTLEEIRKIISLPCQGSEQILDAVAEGLRRVKLRPEAQPYFILVTDEPSSGQHSAAAVIQLCLEAQAKVSVIGTFDPFQQGVARETNGVWVPIPDGKTADNTSW